MPAVIFDFDGLMIDSEHEIATCVLAALADRGVAVSVDEIAHLFGATDTDDQWEAMLDGLFGGAFRFGELEAELDQVLPARMDALPLLPGVADLLDAARTEGWKVGLATGHRRARLDEHLRRLGVDDQFEAIVTAQEVPRGKPAPDIYLAAAARLGVAPEDCLAVEDSVPGCRSALAAGMAVVVCPSRVTAGCDFPPEVKRVASLTEVTLELRASA